MPWIFIITLLCFPSPRRNCMKSFICWRIGDGHGMIFVILNLTVLGLNLNHFILQMNGTTFLKELVEICLLRMLKFKKVLLTLWNFVFGYLIEGRLWLEQVINQWHILSVLVYVSIHYKLMLNYCISSNIGFFPEHHADVSSISSSFVLQCVVWCITGELWCCRAIWRADHWEVVKWELSALHCDFLFFIVLIKFGMYICWHLVYR